MEIISREEYEDMLKLVHPHDRALRQMITPSCVGLPSFSEEEKETSQEDYLSLRIEEPVQPYDPYLPPAPPVLERQEGLYISRTETSVEEC